MNLKDTICLLLIFSQAVIVSITYAFDDDKTINDVVLKKESFIDINAAQFRKSDDLVWQNSLNGIRMWGGSIDTDRAYLETELKIHHELSENVHVGIQWEKEELYANKPQGLALVEIEVVSSNYPISFSLLGSPAHDKRQADLGYALTIGRNPEDYIKLFWLKVDTLYNDKNDFDNSRYTEYGENIIIKASYTVSDKLKIKFDFNVDRPLNFIFDNQTTQFSHESYDHNLNIIYQLSSEQFVGYETRLMKIDKALFETPNIETQLINYRQFDLYWVNNFKKDHELTFGAIYDDFKNTIRNNDVPSESLNFKLSTTQLYTSIYHKYSTHEAWDAGLYVGRSQRTKNYLTTNSMDEDSDSVQAKLRVSWGYHSADRKSHLELSFSLNLDDLRDDPGDGGAIKYQGRF